MTNKELEEYLEEKNIIMVHLIVAYDREIRGLIGDELQQLLVRLFFEGDEFAKRKIQEYCFKLLKREKLLWEERHGDHRHIYLLDDCSYL